MDISGFDWDHGNWPKCGKHGVSRAQIERLFLEGKVRVAPDVKHSNFGENRHIAVGTVDDRAMFVAFVVRDGLIRPVSARFGSCTPRKPKAMKRVPELKTDAQAEAFLEQDLSDLDFSQFKPMRFEIAKKETSLNLRLPTVLMEAVRAKAKAQGVPYSRYVRMLLEADVQR